VDLIRKTGGMMDRKRQCQQWCVVPTFKQGLTNIQKLHRTLEGRNISWNFREHMQNYATQLDKIIKDHILFAHGHRGTSWLMVVMVFPSPEAYSWVRLVGVLSPGAQVNACSLWYLEFITSTRGWKYTTWLTIVEIDARVHRYVFSPNPLLQATAPKWAALDGWTND